ncbi:hypothetical protein [Pseudohoeflea coraliihabitans]|uniref:Secreted protein n=1 Tax=Pseudohoeflea coraliihabitans TaxID=2860393 RepID=A0ABS6WP09_9HYPH|nr:hypothetical protein [Pseudohoeflea sp. DP4N28-3]MBW3097701.1 hypothetical protein [Pseudohoeflea sp. DP4N28-3]
MPATAFVLTVLACSQNGLVCREAQPAMTFESAERCEAAITETLDRVSRRGPEVKAGCVAEEVAERSGRKWAITATRQFASSFERVPFEPTAPAEMAVTEPAPAPEARETASNSFVLPSFVDMTTTASLTPVGSGPVETTGRVSMTIEMAQK